MPRDRTFDDARAVTFVAPGGELVLRVLRNDSQVLCNTAIVLKARYFVVQDGFNAEQNLPVWGVFDLTRCDPAGGGPKVWAMADPFRTFVAPTSDAAVMFAQALGRV